MARASDEAHIIRQVATHHLGSVKVWFCALCSQTGMSPYALYLCHGAQNNCGMCVSCVPVSCASSDCVSNLIFLLNTHIQNLCHAMEKCTTIKRKSLAISHYTLYSSPNLDAIKVSSSVEVNRRRFGSLFVSHTG